MKWTDEDRKFLWENRKRLMQVEIARRLGRSPNAIHCELKRLKDREKAKKPPKTEKEMYESLVSCNNSEGSRHKCWSCGNAVNTPEVFHWDKDHWRDAGVCPWADRLEPVEGWVIEDNGTRSYKGETEETFIILECPLYKWDGRSELKNGAK